MTTYDDFCSQPCVIQEMSESDAAEKPLVSYHYSMKLRTSRWHSSMFLYRKERLGISGPRKPRPLTGKN